MPSRFRDVSSFEKGEMVMIKIPFTGSPKPSVRWEKDGMKVHSSRHHCEVTERHATLSIAVSR